MLIKIKLKIERQVRSLVTGETILSPRFGAIAAVLHGAPARAVVSARINKEPPAGIILKFAHASKIIRGQQIGGRAGDGVEHLRQIVLPSRPVPSNADFPPIFSRLHFEW